MAKIENQEEVKRVIDSLDSYAKRFDVIYDKYEDGFWDSSDLGDEFIGQAENLIDILRKARVIIRTLNQ